MQTCWPMSKLIDGERSRAEGGILPLVAFQANFSRAANVSCLGFKRNLHNVELNYTGNNSQLYTYSTFPPSLNVATKLYFQWANVSFDTLTTDIVIIPFVPFSLSSLCRFGAAFRYLYGQYLIKKSRMCSKSRARVKVFVYPALDIFSLSNS